MYGLAEILGALRDEGVAVVVTVGEVVVGAAAARVGGDRGWVVLLALADDWRGRGLGSTMLTELEKRLMGQGVHRLSALLAEGETGVNAFRNCGYETRDLTYFERVVPLQPQEVGLLDDARRPDAARAACGTSSPAWSTRRSSSSGGSCCRSSTRTWPRSTA